VPGVPHGSVVERPSFVHRDVDAVAEVVAERRTVKDAPAALVCYVHTVIAVVVDRARIYQDVSYTPPNAYRISNYLVVLLDYNNIQ